MSTSSPALSIQDLSSWDEDPTLYLFTSLTAGSSHIVTATARITTILKAARIPYVAVDTATDERARKLWARRAKGKKIPGLVKEGFVIADLDEVEEWNEFGELEDNIGPVPEPQTTSTTAGTGKPLSTITNATTSTAKKSTTPLFSSATTKLSAADDATTSTTSDSPSDTSRALPIRQLASEAAEKAKVAAGAVATGGKGGGGSGTVLSGVGTGTDIKGEDGATGREDVKESEATEDGSLLKDEDKDNGNKEGVSKNDVPVEPEEENNEKGTQSSKEQQTIDSTDTNKQIPVDKKSEEEPGIQNDRASPSLSSSSSSSGGGNDEKTEKTEKTENTADLGEDKSKTLVNADSEDAKTVSDESVKRDKVQNKDETIKPQLQDAKSGDDAGVSNMD